MVTRDGMLRAVLEQLPEGIVIIDADDRLLFVNETAEELRQIKADEVVGRTLLSCHQAESQKMVTRALQYLRRTDTRTFTRMVTDQRRDRYYENAYAPIRDSSSHYIGAMIVSRDITDRRKLEEERATHLQEMEAKVAELTEKLQDLFVASGSALITALEAKDPYTKGHSLRVSEVSVKMAEYIWGASKESREIKLAAQFHDIGKVGVRESVLNKPGKLTEEEFAHVREHTIVGERILTPIDRLRPIARIVRHHHERFDGRGYPGGLGGEEIPEGSRVLALADTYDAMTSVRPYRPALTHEDAVEEIKRNLGTQFCPRFGRIFLELFYSGSIG